MAQYTATCLVILLLGACENSGAPSEDPIDPDPAFLQHRAVLARGTSRSVVVLGETNSVSALTTIAESGDETDPNEFWWISVDVPSDLKVGRYEYDAATPQALVFRQNYRDNCSGGNPEPRYCFLLEEYTAGDEGFTGEVVIDKTPEGIAVTANIAWEGITDRFDSGLSWHRHETSLNEGATGDLYSEVDLR